MSNNSSRQRFVWLHATLGIGFALPLVILFFSGALSCIDHELNLWMQPDLSAHPGLPTAQALDRAADRVWRMREQGHDVSLLLPNARAPYFDIIPTRERSSIGQLLNPQTGEPVRATRTRGGQFFLAFHRSFFLPAPWGEDLVECTGVALIVILGAGLFVQARKLSAELLMFRPRKPLLRAWLDAHKVGGVLFLPFLFTMGYSGTFLRGHLLFAPLAKQQPTYSVTAHPSLVFKCPSERPALSAVLTRAELHQSNIAFARFSARTITLFTSDTGRFAEQRTATHVDACTGKMTQKTTGETGAPSLRSFPAVMRGIHLIHWAPGILRVLYFFSGIVGAFVIGSGALVYLQKRGSDVAYPALVRFGEGIFLWAMLGFPCAVLGYLWLNRLSPLQGAAHMRVEVGGFYLIWFASLLYFQYRSAKKAWRDGLSIIAVLTLFLTPIDLFTRHHAWHTLCLLPYAAIDAGAIVLGVIALVLRRASVILC